MSGILAPGYLRWDGTKYVTDPTVEIVGPPGPPGAPSGTPAGGDLLGTFPDPIVVGLRGLPISASIPTSGQVLEFNGSSWAPSSISTTLGGDVTGATSSNTVSKIQGVAISGTPAAGYVLEATGSTAASWQAPGSTITLSGDVTGAANANTVDKINGTSVPATPIANQVLVATTGITAVWQLITDSQVTSSPGGAISGTKIVPSFGSQNISTTGTLSAGTTTVTSLQDTGLSTGVVHSNSSGNFTSSLVVNADVSSSAAITVNKLAAGTSAQILLNNATPTPTWTSVSGDATINNTGVVDVTGILNHTLPALADGYLTWTGSVWAFTSGTGGGGGGFTAGGDLTGTSSSQQVVSLSGTTGSVQAQIGPLGAGAGIHYPVKGVIGIPNNNNAGELDIIMERNNINTADQNILGYSFGVLTFGNTAQVTAVVGNSVQLNTANGTPFVVSTSAATMTGLPTFQWSAATAAPLITQLTQTSDAATNNLTISPQAPFASASTNKTGGNLVVNLPAPVAGGNEAELLVERGGSARAAIMDVSGYGALYLGTTSVSSPSSNNSAMWGFGNNCYLMGCGGNIFLRPTGTAQSIGVMTADGWQFGNEATDFGGGSKVIGISNATTPPVSTASAGGILYSTSNFITLLGGTSGGVQLLSGDKATAIVVGSEAVGIGGDAFCNIFLGTNAAVNGGAGVVGLQTAGTLPTSAGGSNGAPIQFYAHALGGLGNPVSFELNAPALTFDGYQNGIKIFQTQAAPALSGQALQILGQQGGTGSTTGGSVLLTPGIGSGGGPNGSIILESGDATSGRITVGDLSNGGVVIQSGGTISDPTFSLITDASATIFTGSVDASTTNYFINYVAPVVQGSIDTISVHPQTAQRQLYTAVGQTTVSGQVLEANIPISSNTSCIMLITSIFRIVVAGSGTAVNDTFSNYQQATFKVDNSGTVSGVGVSQNSIGTSTDTSLTTSAITIGLATANTIHVELIPNYSGTAATGDGTLWIEVLFN